MVFHAAYAVVWQNAAGHGAAASYMDIHAHVVGFARESAGTLTRPSGSWPA